MNQSACKGRGVIVINCTDYVVKCEEMLKSKQFVQLQDNPAAKFERKVQNKLLELKKNKRFTEEEYRSFYPSGSRPGRFYATAKRHKVQEGNTNARDLPLRPIVSNIGTATYGVSKYLAKLLQPLSVFVYNIKHTGFCKQEKEHKSPRRLPTSIV